MRVGDVSQVSSILTPSRVLPQAQARFKSFYEMAGFLRKKIDAHGDSMAVRELTLKIVFPECVKRDEDCQAMAIGRWVQENITYVHEGRERFQSPQTTVRTKAGDCDDMTILICACLRSIGIKNKACILKINGRWAHIFPVAFVKISGEKSLHRLTLDATLDEPIDDLVNPIAKTEEAGHRVKALFV
jgi:hypothetical protein